MPRGASTDGQRRHRGGIARCRYLVFRRAGPRTRRASHDRRRLVRARHWTARPARRDRNDAYARRPRPDRTLAISRAACRRRSPERAGERSRLPPRDVRRRRPRRYAGPAPRARRAARRRGGSVRRRVSTLLRPRARGYSHRAGRANRLTAKTRSGVVREHRPSRESRFSARPPVGRRTCLWVAKNVTRTPMISAHRRSRSSMSETTCHMSISLDGFVAGPDQSLEHPLGRRGIELHHWHLDEPLHDADARARDLLLRPRGAYVMGRNMFGPIRGPWQSDWRGWWGDEPPYHAPVFVLTHYEHEPIELAGGTTFYFVGDGFDAAFARASEAAGDRGVDIAGGASTVRQALAAGVVDELVLDVVPVLLGSGERLFDGVADPRLEPVEVIHSPLATHVRYRVGRSARLGEAGI